MPGTLSRAARSTVARYAAPDPGYKPRRYAVTRRHAVATPAGREGGRAIVVAHAAAPRPGLVLFYSPSSGRCRRVEGFIAQVLQRRRNHDTFTLYRVDETSRPDLVARFRVREFPTLVVVERNAVRSRLADPRSCREIERFLAPWLQ